VETRPQHTLLLAHLSPYQDTAGWLAVSMSKAGPCLCSLLLKSSAVKPITAQQGPQARLSSVFTPVRATARSHSSWPFSGRSANCTSPVQHVTSSSSSSSSSKSNKVNNSIGKPSHAVLSHSSAVGPQVIHPSAVGPQVIHPSAVGPQVTHAACLSKDR
jgi:hypothetical protein